MDLLTYDFETFYSKEYTLRKMSAAEYILDQRFEALGCGFKLNSGPSFWVKKPDLPKFIESVDWDNVFAICHNGLFDACILKWVYGANPKMLGDTMAMSRNWLAYQSGENSLASLARWLGRPPKMTTLNRTYGKTYDMIEQEPELARELHLYGPDDCDICYDGFVAMLENGFPRGQLDLIDMQIRMGTTPHFSLDMAVLTEYLGEVIASKEALLAKLGMDLQEGKDGLGSNEKLALLLQSHGLVDLPMKPSPSDPSKLMYAFAKSDEAFTDLLDHQDPIIQTIVAARLGVKSTIEETRTARFISIGNLWWPPTEVPNALPIALKFSGAHTHRYSGDWKLNEQNLGRGSKIRKAMVAPPGKKVVSVDASQIEARMTATMARMVAEETHQPHSDLVEQFERGEDVYANFATEVFKAPIDKKTRPGERFIGKVGILSLGYGASWAVFQNMVRVQSQQQLGSAINLPDAMCNLTVTTYRTKHSEIQGLWRSADRMIEFMASCEEGDWKQWGPVWVGKQVIVLPNGNRLNYKDLHQEVNKDGRAVWIYRFGKRIKFIYGAKLVENVIQALAFCHIMEAAQRVHSHTQGLLNLAHQVHDELVYVVFDHQAPAVAELVKTEIRRRPTWMPRVPLDAESGIGPSYGEAK